MNEIKIFENEQFGKIRTMTNENGETFFVGKDVAEILGYKKTANAIATHVDIEDKGVIILGTPGGNQQVTIINESGLYSLILSSKMPSAKSFKRWITSEVLPSIRKTGSYSVPSYHVPQNFAEALKLAYEQQLQIEQMTLENKELNAECEMLEKLENKTRKHNVFLKDENANLKKENEFRKQKGIDDMHTKNQLRLDLRNRDIKIDKLQIIIGEQKPKVENYDKFINADGTYTIQEVAKILNFKNIGQKNLFKALREIGVLMNDNTPYQKYIDRGYFKLNAKTRWSDALQAEVPYQQTVVSPSGVEFIKRKLEKLKEPV